MRWKTILVRTAACFSISLGFMFSNVKTGIAQNQLDRLYLPLVMRSNQTNPSTLVQVLPNYTDYLSYYGWLFVVGEVVNTSDQNLKSVMVHTRFFGSASREITRTDDTPLPLGNLPAHETTCFLVSLYNPSGWTSYLTEVASVTPGGQAAVDLSVSNIIGEVDPYYQWFHITGDVRNHEWTTVSQINLVGTLYSAEGKVLDCAYASPDNSALAHGLTSPFDISFQNQYPEEFIEALHHFKIQTSGDAVQ